MLDKIKDGAANLLGALKSKTAWTLGGTSLLALAGSFGDPSLGHFIVIGLVACAYIFKEAGYKLADAWAKKIEK